MKKLIPINYDNQRIMTTKVLAKEFGTEENNIKNNFNNNKSRFVEGKHYFKLQGEELKEFKRLVNDIDEALKFAPVLYLWTDRGAARHAKILDTDEAWEVYEKLEETYFNPKDVQALNTSQLSPELQMFNKMFQALANNELEQKKLKVEIADTKDQLQGIRDVVAINTSTSNWREDCRKIIVKIAHKLGGNGFIGDINKEVYAIMRTRLKVRLDVKLTNLRRRMAEEGVCKSKRDNANYLDVIKDDSRLIEGYVAIVKEMAIKYGADMKEAI